MFVADKINIETVLTTETVRQPNFSPIFACWHWIYLNFAQFSNLKKPILHINSYVSHLDSSYLTSNLITYHLISLHII